MKKYLKYILVVEGKEDAAYLSNYIASEIVILNGYELADSLINYLKDRTIILLTDPDEAGIIIRNKLNTILPKVINVEIDINKCNRGSKKGVAECEINEILTKLKLYYIDEKTIETSLKYVDLYELGISQDKELRLFVCRELNLGDCNNKQLFKRLVNNKIDLDTLRKTVNKYKNGN